jgi:hypothetical protein
MWLLRNMGEERTSSGAVLHVCNHTFNGLRLGPFVIRDP